VELENSALRSYTQGKGKVIVPVWAVRAAITFPLGVERTYMWPVALVIRLCPCQLLQHLQACRRRPTVIQLVLTSRLQ
jgi:hypothetical protein